MWVKFCDIQMTVSHKLIIYRFWTMAYILIIYLSIISLKVVQLTVRVKEINTYFCILIFFTVISNSLICYKIKLIENIT